MKRFLLFCLSLCLLVSAVSCGVEPIVIEKEGTLQTPDGEIYPEPFLTFDSEEVSFAEFRYYYLNYKEMYLREDPDYFKTEGREEALKEEVLRCLLESWAVKLIAKENRIQLSSDEAESVEGDVQASISQYGSEEEFIEAMKSSYMSMSLFRSMMRYSALYLKTFDTLYADGGKQAWTDEEFFAYYREHYLAVQEIYLPFEESETKDNCTATMEKAEEILAKARGGEDFWKLVEKYGKDDRMLDYPDGYYITEGEAETALYDAAKALSIGSISEPVIGKDGVWILKRVELREVRMRENRQTALFGYTDTFDQYHAGAYDDDFHELYSARADQIQVEYSPYWELVSTETVA